MTPKSYVKNVARLKSENFFPVLVPPSIMQAAVLEAMAAGVLVDVIKKALFYGKPYTAPQRLINVAGSMPDHIRSRGFNSNAVPVDIQHAILGAFSEASELVEAMAKSAVDGEPLDLVNLDEEFGDLLWYIALYCSFRGVDLEQIMAKNIAKLNARYAAKTFTAAEALERDLDAEREALEGSDEDDG